MNISDIIANIEPAAWIVQDKLYRDQVFLDRQKAQSRAEEREMNSSIIDLYTRDQLLQALSDAAEKTMLHQSDAKMAWGEAEAERQRADRAEAEVVTLKRLDEASESTFRHWRSRAEAAETERDAALLRLKVYEEVDADLNAKFLKISDARLNQAEELLKPFAQVAANFPVPTASRQDDHIWCAYVDDAITYGDLRAAARFLENTHADK